MQSNTNFGVEIEFTGIPRSCTMESFTRNFVQNTGLDTHSESYNHYTRNWWKFVPDGSVTGSSGFYGYELVSPILNGQNGLNDVRRALNGLSQVPTVTSNSSCGIHVHVDCNWLNGYTSREQNIFFNLVATMYAKNEQIFDSFVKRQRRDNRNLYCRTMRDNDIIEQRYRKVNLVHAFERHGTIEFRHLHGTLNADAVCAWIQLVVIFLDNCRALFEARMAANNVFPRARAA